MGKIHFSVGIDKVIGALDSDHKLIIRQKHLHDPRGVITKECALEGYLQEHKRDYKHKTSLANKDIIIALTTSSVP
jgi:hypothetical protein